MEKRKNSVPRNRMVGVCTLVMVVMLCGCCGIPLTLGGGGAFFYGVTEANAVTENLTETLTLPRASDGVINLQIDNPVGDVRVRGADDVEVITVEITKRASGLTDTRAREALERLEVDVRYDEDSDTYIIESTGTDDNFQFTEQLSIDLRITVPRRVNINATANVGTLSVRDVRIMDTLNLNAATGSVEFSGVISPDSGESTIASSVGSVSLLLEEGSAFELNASAEVGGIDSNLALTDQESDSQEVGETLSGTYGNPDGARLKITADVGGIELRD